MMSLTQNRLATGKKVNSALDNPTNFFTAQGLGSRAADLGNLLDGIGNSIKTLEAADNGIKAITKLVESAQSTVRQAQQANNSSNGTHIQSSAGINTSGVTGTSTKDRGGKTEPRQPGLLCRYELQSGDYFYIRKWCNQDF